MRIVAVAAACLIVSACSSEADAPQSLEKQEESKPVHRYDDRDGDVYLYVGELSQDDKDAGKSTGNVVGFKYRGIKDGQHVLELVDDDGVKLSTSTCADPCRFIKSKSVLGTERIPFSENSIIGSAFSDAFNGFLEPAGQKSK